MVEDKLIEGRVKVRWNSYKVLFTTPMVDTSL